MSETGNHSPSQPTEQHGENLLTEPGQEETQVCYLHCLLSHICFLYPNTPSSLFSSTHSHCFLLWIEIDQEAWPLSSGGGGWGDRRSGCVVRRK